MPATPGKTRIGFIGLGIMGAPMARNLTGAGFSLQVYNRSDRPGVEEVVGIQGSLDSAQQRQAGLADLSCQELPPDSPDAVVVGKSGAQSQSRLHHAHDL